MPYSTSELTPRQRQILQLAADGLSNAEIARRLDLDRHTVAHVFNAVYRKFGVRQARHQAIYVYLKGVR